MKKINYSVNNTVNTSRVGLDWKAYVYRWNDRAIIPYKYDTSVTLHSNKYIWNSTEIKFIPESPEIYTVKSKEQKYFIYELSLNLILFTTR